jgi:lipopolysaccharide transport system ATP-binding protein
VTADSRAGRSPDAGGAAAGAFRSVRRRLLRLLGLRGYRERLKARPDPARPAIFHVTHWKAGSQWIHRILLRSAWRLVVPPAGDGRQFLHEPVQPGMVYPTLYLTREQFLSVPLPRRWHRFVVIRDLRDTLVSAYYSLAFSHRADAPGIAAARQALSPLSCEEGLLYLLEHWLPACARIQASWLDAGEPVIRFEDLLEDDCMSSRRF